MGGGGVGNGREGKICMPLCVYINLIHTFMCDNHKSGVCFFPSSLSAQGYGVLLKAGVTRFFSWYLHIEKYGLSGRGGKFSGEGGVKSRAPPLSMELCTMQPMLQKCAKSPTFEIWQQHLQ